VNINDLFQVLISFKCGFISSAVDSGSLGFSSGLAKKTKSLQEVMGESGDDSEDCDQNQIMTFLKTASSSNVVILPGSAVDEEYDLLYRNATFEDWDWDGECEEGPKCGLCDKLIWFEGIDIVNKGTRYFVYFMNDFVDDRDRDHCGMLQCSYCFDFFHRRGCSLSMSDCSYMAVLKSRTWACPTCVPKFIPEIIMYDVDVMSEQPINLCMYDKGLATCNDSVWSLSEMVCYFFSVHIFDNG
jgi:hypothetical protein